MVHFLHHLCYSGLARTHYEKRDASRPLPTARTPPGFSPAVPQNLAAIDPIAAHEHVPDCDQLRQSTTECVNAAVSSQPAQAREGSMCWR